MVAADEWVYRVACAVLFGLFVSLWLRAALRSGLSKSFLYDSSEGVLIAVIIRLLLLLSIFLLGMYCLLPGSLGFAGVDVSAALRWQGVLLTLAGTWLIDSVFRHLGQQFSTSLALREHHQLIISGPYRFVRHPMYIAYLLTWLGLSLLAANVLLAASGVIGLGLVMVIRTPQEEAQLLAEFGSSYRAYRDKTGRYLPRLLPEK